MLPEFYVKSMEKVLIQSDRYTVNEVSRLTKVRAGKLAYYKKQEFKGRINILKSMMIADLEDEL